MVAGKIKTYNDFLKEAFPQWERMRKVALNAGFGCPNLDGSSGTGGCAYCNNSSFGQEVTPSEFQLLKRLEKGMYSARKNKKEVGILAYFQSYTNTYAPVQKLWRIYTPIISHPEVAGLSIGTRPDCLQNPVVDLLSDMNKIKPVIAEIGIQTVNDDTLKRINRNHTAECSHAAAAHCKSAGLLMTAHIIIGLPGEGMEDFINTAKFVKESGFSSIKIHPLHIVKNTRFADEYREGKIKLMSMDDYCRAAAEVIRIALPDIAIERVSGESLNDTLIAPAWSGEREKIWAGIHKHLDAN